MTTAARTRSATLGVAGVANDPIAACGFVRGHMARFTGLARNTANRRLQNASCRFDVSG
jgi:hypothetical protein